MCLFYTIAKIGEFEVMGYGLWVLVDHDQPEAINYIPEKILLFRSDFFL